MSDLQIIRLGSVGGSALTNTNVRSTVSGTVLQVPVKEGDQAIEANTFNPGTTIATVADLNKMIFEGRVDEGEVGEVCIKGDNVTLGYENNSEANKKSFSNGWFRTGDQGYFDQDGYLKISGRLKEIINKGGEKISPLEVDNILMDHPLIEQAVCFGYEDKMLGEEIAAAIIIKEGQNCSETDIKNYAEEKLAKFKIPKKIFFVNEIPKGATGKLQRNVLAKNFGLNN